MVEATRESPLELSFYGVNRNIPTLQAAGEPMNLQDLKMQMDYEAFWLEKVGRRIEKLERGESRLIPLEEALKIARAARAKPIEANK